MNRCVPAHLELFRFGAAMAFGIPTSVRQRRDGNFRVFSDLKLFGHSNHASIGSSTSQKADALCKQFDCGIPKPAS
jgi:hypothetical protein